VYMFFASLMLCSIAFAVFLLPETKGIPLEAMDRLFEVKPVWRANRVIMEELHLQDEEFRRAAGDLKLNDDVKPGVNQVEGDEKVV